MQLKSRKWKVIDSHGRTQEVSGSGVVGGQPVLKPTDAYEYASGISLSTPSAIMQGSYKMLTENDEWIEIEVPTFSLDSPYESRTKH